MQISNIFQIESESGEVIDAPRPQCEGLTALITAINKHYGTKDEVVNAFVGFYINHLKYQVWHKYQAELADYEADKSHIEAENAANIENPEYDVKPLPVKPVWSDDDVAMFTTEYVLALPEVKAAIRTKEKQQRQLELDNATVDVDGMTFDADELSQQRFMFALAVAEQTGQTSTQWKLSDNTWSEVTVTQMKAVLVASGVKLAEIMQKYG